MSRKGKAIQRIIAPDKKFGSVLIQKLIHKIMLKGKKSVATNIVYSALELASKKLSKDPLAVFQMVIDNVSPMLQLKSRRIGGSNYQIPSEISADKKVILALQWIVIAARNRKGMPMAERLSAEFVDAFNNTGGAVKKKEETHRMAEANRAFAHFGRF